MLVAPLHLPGQSVSTAGLRGRIVDTDGTPVEAALVTLTHIGSGVVSKTLSVAGGRYMLRGRRPGGPYRITVAHIGFRDFVREDIELLLGRFVDLEIALVPEAIDLEELVVQARQDPEFNPGRIGIATLVTSEVLREFPTITRNLIDLSALSPLVRVSEEGVSVVGGNYRFNTLNVDGALNQDVFGLSMNSIAGGRAGGRVIPLDAVEQFQVEVAPFDIRLSGFTGGALNAVTKSGTNKFEASAFGFHRAGGLVGELVVDDFVTVPELSTARGGFTVSGPVRRDRAHFFVAGEWERVREPPTGFHVGETDPLRLSLLPDSVNRLRSILGQYGVDPGTASSFSLENRLANLFARFDWEMGERHDAMFRYSFAAADDDVAHSRLPGDAYQFSSNAVAIRSRNHSAVLRLVSSFGNRLSNEFSANVQILSDNETPESAFPEVEVRLNGVVDSLFITRGVRAGAHYFAQNNGLDQRVLQASNNLSYDVGSHHLLFGTSGTWFSFDRRFVPGALGRYEFGSLEELLLNRPDRYEITIPNTDQGAAQSFQVSELALYAQDEWEAHDRLTLRAGVRLDLPAFAGRPERNPELHREFAIHVSELPGDGATWSARAGINWRPLDGTQLRAGTGLFTGRPAFAWLANAFRNNGLAVTRLLCRGRLAPQFDPSGPAPKECVGGPDAGRSPPVVNYFAPDFSFPQDWRTMFAIDQRLPGGVVLSASWISNIARRQIFIANENLGEKTDSTFTDGLGFEGRDVWGVPVDTIEGVLFHGGRISDLFGPVLRVGNRNGNYSYAATIEVRKDFGGVLELRTGYSLTRSADLQDLLSIDVTSNYGTTPISLHPNDPPPRRSRFDRPHKVVASARVRFPPRSGGTAVSLMYVGQSGAPYSYVYQGDVNGDGFPGPRGSRLANDLVHVPEQDFRLPTGFVARIIWTTLVEQEECLKEQLGRILARNSCEAPWSNRLDLRVSQTIEALGLSADATLDMMNVLNFLDSSRGLVHVSNPVVQIWRAFRTRPGPDDACVPDPPHWTCLPNPLELHYLGGIRRAREPGRIGTALRPWAPEVPTSQWRVQLGLRMRRGGR